MKEVARFPSRVLADKRVYADLLIIGQKPKRINLLKFERVLKRDINHNPEMTRMEEKSGEG